MLKLEIFFWSKIMEQLEYLFEQSVKKQNIVERKVRVESPKTQIISPPFVGASSLIFSILNLEPSNSYIYIDLDDYRIDKRLLSLHLDTFCQQHSIKTVAIENFDGSFALPHVAQIIISTLKPLPLDNFDTLYLMPLDFEEFLALDNRYETLDNALSHFLQIGGFPQLIHVASANRHRHMQDLLKRSLNELELEVLNFVAKQMGQKISIFHIFDRLKKDRKLSKDHFYKTFYNLIENRWLLWLEKYAHPKATKKLYLIDFALKGALTFSKNFSQVFESMVFLELKKVGKEVYYDDDIDFYIPDEDRVIITLPFATEKSLFTLMEKIEGWLITHGVQKMEVVTMNSESQLNHPFLKVEMIPFTRWALIES
jgi:hypothetical protein